VNIAVLRIIILSLVTVSQGFLLFAQDERGQYPRLLRNSYIDFDLGYIDYPFTNSQLSSGSRAESIDVKHLGMRVVLGHRFNKFLSAQIGYMKPLKQLVFENVNGDDSNHTVWMHEGTFSVLPTLPVSERVSIFGEAGLAVVTRRGFEINDAFIIDDTTYGAFLFGGGVEYQLNKNWDLVANALYSPAKEKFNQPYTIFYSGGIRFNLNPLPANVVEQNSSTPYIFPRNSVQIAYSTNVMGYSLNNFFSHGIFFGGRAQVADGVWIRYQRNVFHTRKLFSLDVGSSVGYWKSDLNNDDFFTMSVFPLFRLTFLHSKPADLYFQYSIAGPSYISKINIDGHDTGEHFTFQDFMGVGIFFGAKRNFTAEVNLNHYSNGNIFPHNEAVKVPLSFSVGYCF
jgi:opacity protein-like surface antigen